MKAAVHELERIFTLLDHVRREWQTSHVLSGLCAFLSLALALGLASVLAAMWLPLSITARWGLLILAVVWLPGSGLCLIFLRLLRSPSDEHVALLIERAHPDLHNELINAVRFAAESRDARKRYLDEAIRESDRKVAELDTRGVVSWRPLRRNALILAAIAITWVVLLGGFRLRALNAMSRIVQPGANLSKAGKVRIVEVIPGDATVIAGENLTIEAALANATDSVSAYVQHFVESGRRHEEKMQPVGENRYRCELLDIKTPRNYRVTAGGSRSREFAIRLTERPVISRIAVEYRFPAYTGMEPVSEEDCAGTIQALKGSTAFLTATSSKRLSAAHITLAGEERVALRLKPGRTDAVTQRPLRIMKSASGQIQIEDEDSCRNSRPINIVAEPDRRPIVKIVAPGADTSLEVGGVLEVAIRGSDDFGVVRAEIVEKRIHGQTAETGEPKVIKEWTYFSDAGNVALHWQWEFKKEAYRNGDVVRYFVRMVDGNDVDGPGVGVSAEFVVRIEDAIARRKEREEEYRSWQADLERLLKEQKELRRETRRLHEEQNPEETEDPQ